ncbi:MAG: DUF5763 domain-containing protein [Chloroflexi bacterium]|nr:DUF5763 domain-containing protein [Chloroflexota bacterium]
MTLAYTVETARVCPAIKKNGERCTAQPGADGYCIGHSPAATEARRRGGAGSSRAARAVKLLPVRLRPIADILENALIEVHEHRLDPREGQAMASLATALSRVVSVGEMEERIRTLESRARQEERDRQSWRL